MTSLRPYIIHKLLNPHTLQREDVYCYFDAVYPVVYANGQQGRHGVGIRRNKLNGTIISPTEYFIIQQLWPEYCATDEQAALALLSPPEQGDFFL